MTYALVDWMKDYVDLQNLNPRNVTGTTASARKKGLKLDLPVFRNLIKL